MKTLLLAGHETSASMLTWSVYELLHDPASAEQVGRAQSLLHRHLTLIPRRSAIHLGMQSTRTAAACQAAVMAMLWAQGILSCWGHIQVSHSSTSVLACR